MLTNAAEAADPQALAVRARHAAEGRDLREARAGVRVRVRRVDAHRACCASRASSVCARTSPRPTSSANEVLGMTRLAALVKAGEPRGKDRVAVEIDGRELVLSNLDKVLYPKVGFTKGDVIDYYLQVAPTMLTHLADRPVTRKRYPNGVDESFFFEKNVAQAPAGLGRDGRDPRRRTKPVDVLRLLRHADARVAREPRVRSSCTPTSDRTPTPSARSTSCSTSIPAPRRRSSSAAGWRCCCATCSSDWGSRRWQRPAARRGCSCTSR